MNNWTLTDPDCEQYGRRRQDLGDRCFEFKQIDIDETIIDLNYYTNDDIERIISSYGYSLIKTSTSYIYKIYNDKDEVDWIIAECIFESEN